eukprot:359307-Chlamydomonas_euryale.AAC.2
MMVERKWPTCISLATLGDEKSTTARFTASFGAHDAMPANSIACTRAASAGRDSFTLMKPGPARLVPSTSALSGSASMMAVPTSRGALGAPSVPLSFPNSAIALLHW